MVREKTAVANNDTEHHRWVGRLRHGLNQGRLLQTLASQTLQPFLQHCQARFALLLSCITSIPPKLNGNSTPRLPEILIRVGGRVSAPLHFRLASRAIFD